MYTERFGFGVKAVFYFCYKVKQNTKAYLIKTRAFKVLRVHFK